MIVYHVNFGNIEATISTNDRKMAQGNGGKETCLYIDYEGLNKNSSRSVSKWTMPNSTVSSRVSRNREWKH